MENTEMITMKVLWVLFPNCQFSLNFSIVLIACITIIIRKKHIKMVMEPFSTELWWQGSPRWRPYRSFPGNTDQGEEWICKGKRKPSSTLDIYLVPWVFVCLDWGLGSSLVIREATLSSLPHEPSHFASLKHTRRVKERKCQPDGGRSLL